MIIAGLTGSIAMGKSTVARIFSEMGWSVFDADAAVREFYRSEGVARVADLFPGVVVGSVIDRARLGAMVLGHDRAFAKLEAIVHPAVAKSRAEFLAAAHARRQRGVFLDIPLLFETGGELSVDVIVVASASVAKQRARALSREGMSQEKFAAILARQIPDEQKRRHAHFIVDTNGTLEDSRRQAQDFLRAIVGLPGKLREPGRHA